MRSIADAAGVNVALLAHYFGNKEGLFSATLELPADVLERATVALAGGFAGAGERLTRSYLGLWEDPGTRGQLMATARSAIAGGEAMHRLHDQLVGAIEQADSAGQPERRPGLVLAASHLLGVAIARYIAQIPPLDVMPFDELVSAVAPAVQLHLGTPAAPPQRDGAHVATA